MILLTSFTTVFLSSSISLADSAKVHCSMGDNPSVAAATANLNASLKKLQVKSASTPVIAVDRLGFVTVCVTVTQ